MFVFNPAMFLLEVASILNLSCHERQGTGGCLRDISEISWGRKDIICTDLNSNQNISGLKLWAQTQLHTDKMKSRLGEDAQCSWMCWPCCLKYAQSPQFKLIVLYRLYCAKVSQKANIYICLQWHSSSKWFGTCSNTDVPAHSDHAYSDNLAIVTLCPRPNGVTLGVHIYSHSSQTVTVGNVTIGGDICTRNFYQCG